MEQVSRTSGSGMPPDADAADTTPDLDTSSLAVRRWRYDSAVHAARALNTPRS
jgi:hypothetical protein